jgi:diphosphomevalonate decarboxylase
MLWSASAPSNIALIKYMGKANSSNEPINSSFSYTLEHLRTYVTLEITETQDTVLPIVMPAKAGIQAHFSNNSLDASFRWHDNEKAKSRFINFFKKLKQQFNIHENFIIRSHNNFPANCGLASSASSFAALTQCALKAFTDLGNHPPFTLETQAKLSQTGSGSSCRSFFSPWCIWTKDSVSQPDLPFNDLIHLVVVVDQQEKRVSSSEAHKQVPTSDLFHTRATRAEKRLTQLITSLQQADWQIAYIIAWQEFWDMHALFETAVSPFHYMTANSLEVLNFARHYWQEHQDGPIVTMDAGPNVHLLFRQDQTILAMDFWHQFQQKYLLLTNMNVSHDATN